MIPYKNIFCGPLGRTKKPGGSRFMTTPHTRNLTVPSYVIDIHVSGEFVCCTLNGRLWLYRTGEGQYSLVALKWNETTGRLEYATSETLSGSDVSTARGIDWILFPNSIIQAIDESPYILTSELFDRTQDRRFCYSLLRSQILSEKPSGMSVTLGPGIDPFTLRAWGLDSANGNTEGWGYFNPNLDGLYPKGTHTMETCYSTLPSVVDWNIVEDFLVRRPSNPLEMEEVAFMKQIRPLIPLELNWYSQNAAYPTYGTGYSGNRRGIQLTSCEGKLYGRGLMHLGRAFIIPAAFDESGQPQEFYLYIGADSGKGPYNLSTNSNLDETDPWLNVGVAALKDTTSQSSQPVGFLSEKGNPLTCGVCQTATTSEILTNDTWINPSPEDDGRIAFDAMNGAGLVLGNQGVTFLSGDTENNTVVMNNEYSCQGMSEWLAPAGQLEGIGQDSVLASFDNGLLMTNIATGFDRLLLTRRTLPLAWGTFETKDAETGKTLKRSRLLMGEGTSGQISVNEIACPDVIDTPVSHVPWNGVYREAAAIRLLNCIGGLEVEQFCYDGPFFISKSDIEEKDKYDSWYGEYFSWPVRAYYEMVFINPDTGELTPATVNVDLTPYYDYEPDPERADGVDYVWPNVPGVNEDGVFGIELQRYIHYRAYGGPTSDGGTVFIPLSSILPEWWDGSWIADVSPGLKMEKKLFFPSTVVDANTTRAKITLPPESPCTPHLVFTESSSLAKFLMKAPSFGSLSENGTATGVLSDILDRESGVYFSSKYMTYTSGVTKDYKGHDKGNKNLHLWSTCNYTWSYDEWTGNVETDRFNKRLFIIRSDLNPAVFDFDAELIKSKLF